MNTSLCLKILNQQQVAAADQYTIKNEPISSIGLMERASENFFNLFTAYYNRDRTIHVFCGVGNNGGDGLNIARLLIEDDYNVQAYIIGNVKRGSQDFETNYQLFKSIQVPFFIKEKEDFPKLTSRDVIVDAVFGSGISRPLNNLHADLVHYLNSSDVYESVAVDMASGLGCDARFDKGVVMRVSRTITFQVPKLSQLLPDNYNNTGVLHLVDIGLDADFINSLVSPYHLLTRDFIQSIIKRRKKFAHKGEMGKCLLVSGSFGKMGAAVLAARACMRSGAGLLTANVPKCGVDIMQMSVPEAMVIASDEEEFLSGKLRTDVYDALGVGPGIGKLDGTAELVEHLIKSYEKPLVLDADALNILSERKELLSELSENSILTPHPREFGRLVGEWSDDYERLRLQREFSQKYQIIVLLKGAHTSISCPDGSVFFNCTGNPGMATAGSGDVLTGMITAFLGRGYRSIEAALLACYIHGLAADIYSESYSQESLIATDIVKHISSALRLVQDNLG